MSVRFSVNIPVYNAEKYIEECVNSVLEQSFGDFEINLVDDGSKDSSAEICRSFADPRIHFYQKENEGPLMARVYALSKAQGEYSLFLDCDDWLEKNCLEIVDRTIKEENCDIVAFSFRRVSENTESCAPCLSDGKAVFENGGILDFQRAFLFNNYLNSMSTKAIKTQLLKSDPTDFIKFAKLRNGEDMIQAFYSVFNAEKIVYLPDCFLNYRINDSSITHSVRTDRYKDILTAREEIYRRFEKTDLATAENRLLFAGYTVKTITECIKEIAKSDSTRESKITDFEAISENEFYKKISVEADTSFLNRKSKLVYSMFRRKNYRMLIALVSGLGR